MSNVRTAPPQAEMEVHGALERDGDILRGKEALSQARKMNLDSVDARRKNLHRRPVRLRPFEE